MGNSDASMCSIGSTKMPLRQIDSSDASAASEALVGDAVHPREGLTLRLCLAKFGNGTQQARRKRE